jgi:hypothetical protein
LPEDLTVLHKLTGKSRRRPLSAVNSRINLEEEMNGVQKRSLSVHFLATALLAVAALLGTAQASLAQDLVRGTFTLPTEARLGNTILPPGEYKFAVQSLETINSVRSIQVGNGRVAVTVSGIAKGARVVSLQANASRPATPDSQKPDSIEFGTGMTIQSISLKNLGVTLEFNGNQTSNVLRARAPEPSSGGSTLRGND